MSTGVDAKVVDALPPGPQGGHRGVLLMYLSADLHRRNGVRALG
ncbi:hypothetical protein [Mycolicibacterium tusciae]|nr:hypothetical protein [Mycolicibacterium tusciae]